MGQAIMGTGAVKRGLSGVSDSLSLATHVSVPLHLTKSRSVKPNNRVAEMDRCLNVGPLQILKSNGAEQSDVASHWRLLPCDGDGAGRSGPVLGHRSGSQLRIKGPFDQVNWDLK